MDALKGMKANRKVTLEVDFERGVKAMREVCGFDFMERRRLKDYAFCRYVLARWLVNRGYPVLEVSQRMGYNHATLMYGFNTLDSFITKRERDIMNNFKALMNDED